MWRGEKQKNVGTEAGELSIYENLNSKMKGWQGIKHTHIGSRRQKYFKLKIETLSNNQNIKTTVWSELISLMQKVAVYGFLAVTHRFFLKQVSSRLQTYEKVAIKKIWLFNWNATLGAKGMSSWTRCGLRTTNWWSLLYSAPFKLYCPFWTSVCSKCNLYCSCTFASHSNSSANRDALYPSWLSSCSVRSSDSREAMSSVIDHNNISNTYTKHRDTWTLC